MTDVAEQPDAWRDDAGRIYFNRRKHTLVPSFAFDASPDVEALWFTDRPPREPTIEVIPAAEPVSEVLRCVHRICAGTGWFGDRTGRYHYHCLCRLTCEVCDPAESEQAQP